MAPLAPYEALVARIGSQPVGTDAERALAALQDASALVRSEARLDWATGPVPEVIQAITLDVARRIFHNPNAITQNSVGDVSVSYSREGGASAAFLSAADRRAIRRAIGRSTAQSIQMTRTAPEAVPTSWEV